MKFIELKNDKITVTLCSLGAAIYRVIYDNNDMMLSPINEQDFDKEGVFYNKTIGRVTGRILKKRSNHPPWWSSWPMPSRI